MARMTATHRTQIIIALITVAGGIIVALLTSWDKFFPPAPPAAENRQPAAQSNTAAPVGGEDPAKAALERLHESQAGTLNRGADALDDISRQIDAQSANLAH